MENFYGIFKWMFTFIQWVFIRPLPIGLFLKTLSWGRIWTWSLSGSHSKSCWCSCLSDALLWWWSGHVSYQMDMPNIDPENSRGITYPTWPGNVLKLLEEFTRDAHLGIMFNLLPLWPRQLDNWWKIERYMDVSVQKYIFLQNADWLFFFSCDWKLLENELVDGGVRDWLVIHDRLSLLCSGFLSTS